MMMRALFALLIGLALAMPAAAQNNAPPRSLFEVLFGGGQTQPPAQQQQQTTPAPRPQSQAVVRPSQPPAPPPPPAVAKAPDARRIAVFGDSMAVDLARALERFYAGDDHTLIIGQGVGSSGFVRDDFFDWNAALSDAIAADSFDVAVVIIGINDRQAIGSSAPLSDSWRSAYSARIERFLSALNGAGKPVIWIELPPMEQPRYGADMVQIAALHRAAVQAAGGAWVETFERYMSEAGGYTSVGPDLNGQIVTMRKVDGIHFSAPGADKLAFYVDRAMGQPQGAGGSRAEVSDLLAGTDAADMMRPPYQGLGQIRLVEMASIVQQIGTQTYRANDLVVAGTTMVPGQGFDIEAMLTAPPGRVDAFGLARPVSIGVENPRGR